MAKIVFISDIHHSANDTGVFNSNPNVVLSHNVGTHSINILLNAIEEISPIDLLIFCGDIINGKDSLEEKKKAVKELKDFTMKLCASSKIFGNNIKPSERIIFVPGNHDMDRDTGELHSEISYFFDRYLSTKTIPDVSNKYSPIFIFDELKLIVAAIPTAENNNSRNEEIQRTIEIVAKLPEECNKEKEEISDYLKKYCNYDIPSITSGTIDDFIDKNHKIRKKSDKYIGYQKIMITHHPLLEGIERGTVVKDYANTVGGYKFMRTAEELGYSLFVHGHLHNYSCVEITDHLSENKRPIVQLGLPSMKIDEDGSGCMLIDINSDDEQFSCTLLKPDSVTWKFKEIPLYTHSRNSDNESYSDHILVDYEISEIIKENNIVKNGDLHNIEAASYDCALGYEYKRGEQKYCDWSSIELQKITSDENGPGGIWLKPGETALIFSYEEFNIPKNMVLHASPISSWLRQGIRFDISYFVDPGFVGKFCIPVTNESEEKVFIDAQKPIISLEFIRLSHCCEKGWREKHPDFLKIRTELQQ